MLAICFSILAAAASSPEAFVASGFAPAAVAAPNAGADHRARHPTATMTPDAVRVSLVPMVLVLTAGPAAGAYHPH
jgi:hypothetical protein